MADIVEIDGSQGEGGGQILRTALALSVVLRRPFRLVKIRANRENPGLAPQHLMAVLAAKAISNAEADGASLGARALFFEPGPAVGGEYRFEIGTAGAVTLLLQAIYFPLALAGVPSTLSLQGGTHVSWSPPLSFLEDEWLPALREMGFGGGLALKRAGYYPRGGGELECAVAAAGDLKPFIREERGNLLRLRARVGVSNLHIQIGRRQGWRVETFAGERRIPCEMEVAQVPGVGPGTFTHVVAEFERCAATFFGLGRRGKRGEEVAGEALVPLAAFLDRPGAVNPHLADQLILPMVLSGKGGSFTTTEVTQHLITNVETVRKFLEVSVTVEGERGAAGRVVVGTAPSNITPRNRSVPEGDPAAPGPVPGRTAAQGPGETESPAPAR